MKVKLTFKFVKTFLAYPLGLSYLFIYGTVAFRIAIFNV